MHYSQRQMEKQSLMSDSRTKRKPKYRQFLISILLSLIILASGLYFIDGISSHSITNRLIFPLIRMMIFIFIGLTAGQIIEATGWSKALSVVARPLFKYGRLGNKCGAVFTSSFISGIAANAMLLDFYIDNKITKKQLFLTNFVNQLPNYFLHLPTTFFIVWPLTGTAGVIYLMITFTAVVLRVSLFLTFGRFTIKEDRSEDRIKKSKETRKSKKSILENIKQKLPERLINIATFVLPVYIFIFMLTQAGIFKHANVLITKYIPVTFIPIESFSVVVLSFFTEFTSGFAAAGAMMDGGLLTTKQTVIALLTGNILAFPLRALRHQLPRYIGIFSPKMGTELLLMGQTFRIVSLIVVGMVYYLLF